MFPASFFSVSGTILLIHLEPHLFFALGVKFIDYKKQQCLYHYIILVDNSCA